MRAAAPAQEEGERNSSPESWDDLNGRRPSKSGMEHRKVKGAVGAASVCYEMVTIGTVFQGEPPWDFPERGPRMRQTT
jgi:hypothetical protein